MTPILRINLVYNNVVAFSIDFDQYFLKINPVPQLFNSILVPQIIPNLDFWFQANTHQRYSYRGFLDMVEAFNWGRESSHTHRDLYEYAVKVVLKSRELILTDKLSDYRKHYWIEFLNPDKLEAFCVSEFRDKFVALRTRLGDEVLFNHLCRLWVLSRKALPHVATVFEKLIGRLGRTPDRPVYPVTAVLDGELVNSVLAAVLPRASLLGRGVSDELCEKVLILANG